MEVPVFIGVDASVPQAKPALYNITLSEGYGTRSAVGC